MYQTLSMLVKATRVSVDVAVDPCTEADRLRIALGIDGCVDGCDGAILVRPVDGREFIAYAGDWVVKLPDDVDEAEGKICPTLLVLGERAFRFLFAEAPDAPG